MIFSIADCCSGVTEKEIAEQMPDMVLMDVLMPGIGGFDTVREMRRIMQDDWIPIIFITAQRDESVRTQLVESGAIGCLFKPFNDTALLDALNAAFRVK